MRLPLDGVTVAFFVPEWSDVQHAVVQSQVVPISQMLVDLGANSILVGCSDRIARSGVQPSVSRRDAIWLMKPLLQRLGVIGMILRCFCAGLRTRRFLRSSNVTHVYVRSIFAALLAMLILRSKGVIVVFDIRAFVSDEVTGSCRRLKASVLRFFELTCIRRADRLLTVTKNLQTLIKIRSERTDVSVIPSCPDLTKFQFSPDARANLRRQLGFSAEHVVICYSGGTAPWQRIDDTIMLFRELSKMDENLRLLLLTRDSLLSAKLKSVDIESHRIKVVSADFSDVASFLSAADVAVVLRHDNALNRAASPIKVGEYLGCGLPVIFSPWIGDLRTVFSNNSDAGFPFEECGQSYDELSIFCRNAKEPSSRAQARCLAEKHFQRSSFKRNYIAAFGLDKFPLLGALS